MRLAALSLHGVRAWAALHCESAGVHEQRGQHTPQGAPPAAKHHRVVQAEHLTDSRKQVVILRRKFQTAENKARPLISAFLKFFVWLGFMYVDMFACLCVNLPGMSRDQSQGPRVALTLCF